MSTSLQRTSRQRGLEPKAKRGVWAGVVVLVLIGVALGTKVVSNDDPLLQGAVKFDAASFGLENFPKVQEEIAERAVDAVELATAIDQDADAAVAKYAESGSGMSIFSVTLSGVVGEGASGIYDIAVDGVPDDLQIRVQTGPAINGTELRDATGEMAFGDFENQIQFQDAAAALNNEMKAEVLSDLDSGALEGSTVTLTGAFSLINHASWLITPAKLEVQ